jgi:hypothetical protein
LQGLQEIWEFPRIDYSWAAAGYQGAISSGNTTCGLLIGTTIAIGLHYGVGKECIPFEDKETRDKAIAEVNDFYQDFLTEFNDTLCRNLIGGLDMGNPEDRKQYMDKEVYKDTCLKYFQFVMKRFIERDKQGL